MAVDAANAIANASSTIARVSGRRCRDIPAATGPANAPVSGCRARRSGRPAAAQEQVGDPPGEQAGADPQQRGSGQRPVRDRDGGHPFGGEHQLVVAARWWR